MKQAPSQATSFSAPVEERLSQKEALVLLRTHYELQRGCFVSETAVLEGGIAAFSSGIAASIWNHAAWLRTGELPAFVESSEQWLRAKERPPVIYIAQASTAERDYLLGRGYEILDRESWLVRDAGGGRRSSRVQEVKTSSDLWKVFARAFKVSERAYRTALGVASNLRHFVLYVDEQPAVVGTLGCQGTLAYIYNIGTAPDFRRRGLARELVEHLIAEIGQGQLVLQVESGSSAEQLYKKLGFKLAFVREGFRSRLVAESTSLARILGAGGEHGAPLRETRPLGVKGASREMFIGAWAYLLHRYTGQDEVTFAVFEEDSGAKAVTVQIDSSLAVQDWLGRLTRVTTLGWPGKLETGLSLGIRKKLACEIELQVEADNAALQLAYEPAAFQKDTVRRAAGHFAQTLQQIASYPDGLVRDIEILSESERHQLLRAWNSTAFEPVQTTAVKLFEEQVERAPEAIALTLGGENREQLSYRQLNRRANRLAHQLQKMGVAPEIPVALLLHRSVEMVVAILAVMKAGGVFVPIDPSYPADRVEAILGDLRSPLLIAAEMRQVPPGCQILMLKEHGGDPNEKNPTAAAKPENSAYVIYTSGSTGRPKGVVVDHFGLANHCLDCRKQYGLSPRDRVLHFSSFSFDAALEQLLPPLISGASIVLRDDKLWTCADFARHIQHFQLTVVDLPTAYFHDLATYWAQNPVEFEHHCLRLVVVGGEALALEKASSWQKASGGRIRLINAYGPTETIITATSYELPINDAPADPAPIGTPRGDRKAYVLDTSGRPVPMGVPGELHIGGTLLARGYYRDQALTSERFIANPFSDDAASRLYKTGDLARYNQSGTLEFLGRLDDQVKVRGYRVELGEIESALRNHHAVHDALVLADRGRLIAFAKASCEGVELKEILRNRLPDFMVPWQVIVVSEWPMLPSGKMDRRSLLAKIENDSTEGASPKDALELQVKLLFERVLKRSPISIDQSFFELGGDSLQALELIVRLEKEAGKRLPLESIYQSSTAEAVARQLRSASGETQSSLVPLQVSGHRPPLYLLHTTPGDVLGYGNLVYRLGPNQPCYGLQSLGLLDAELCQISINQMAAYYVRLITEFQSAGPYYLAGWCYGGIVAVEMARLLKSQGAEIGLLALFETVAMPARISNARYYAHRLSRMIRMSPNRWLTYAREKARYNQNARIANRMRFREASADSPRDPRLVQLEKVYHTNMKALREFRSRYYDGTVTLFNASEKDPALIPDQEYGWVGLAREIKIYEVPGNHDTMLAEPNVSILAQQLNHCLDEAQTTLRTSP